MKTTASLFLIFLISMGVASLRADDQTATVQQQLKDQGFYYGQVDGQAGTETTAAIRRYQIRNGLQVDGTLNQETLNSLKATEPSAAGAAAAGHPPPPPQPAPLAPQQQAPPANPSVTQSDREFLNKQNGTPAPPPPQAAPSDNSNVVPPPVVVPPQAPPLAAQYTFLFAHTPYESAPLVVQQGTLKNAQMRLGRQSYYNGAVDGIPGPGTLHAISAFQSDEGLPRTGRLDFDTLNALHLLPNSGPPPVRRVIVQPFYPPPRYYEPPQRVYRGVW